MKSGLLARLAKPAENLIVGGRFSFFLSAKPEQDSAVAGTWPVVSGNVGGREAKQEFL